MITVLISVRDFLFALALAWVGITLVSPAPHAEQHARPVAGASAPASCSDARACSASHRPHFDALNCDDQK